MFEHFILVYSDYKTGKRIGFHKYNKDIKYLKQFKNYSDTLKKQFPGYTFGFHHLKTDSKKWESVKEYDAFFDDVYPITDFKVFKNMLNVESEISSVDIAKLITSRIECTHLKLQKLLYFFYESYIKKYNEAPFQEKFLAWQHGPVIREVYEVYKHFGREKICDEEIEDNNLLILKDDDFKISVYSRFVQAPKYVKYLETLESVIDEFSKYEAWQLVDLTHEPGTPWYKVSEGGIKYNQEIKIELIKEC